MRDFDFTRSVPARWSRVEPGWSSRLVSWTAVASEVWHPHLSRTSMSGSGSLGCFCTVRRTRKSYQGIREIGETLSRYLISRKEWAFTAN